MRYPTCILVFVFSVLGYREIQAQVPKPKIVYTAVEFVDSVSKEELYRRARRFFTYNCDEIKFDSKEEIAGKGYFQFDYTFSNTRVGFTMIVQLKNGRYKYEISAIYLESFRVNNGTSLVSNTPLEEESAKFKEVVDGKIKNLIAILESTIKAPLDDNW
jgi:hypothetical protein